MTSTFQSFTAALVGLALFMSAVAMDSASSDFSKNDLVRNSSDSRIVSRLLALRQLVQDNGCRANVCFILQGDDSISSIDFQNQKSFVDLIASVITTDDSGGLCALQYGGPTQYISPLTDDRDLFFDRLDMARKVGGKASGFAEALDKARSEFIPHSEAANKIVLLTNYFDIGRSVAKSVSQTDFLCNLPVCLVSVGQLNLKSTGFCPLLNLFPVSDFFHLLEIIDALVFDICGI